MNCEMNDGPNYPNELQTKTITSNCVCDFLNRKITMLPIQGTISISHTEKQKAEIFAEI